MKKSIAFLGALLFGSITFGQVTKNDSINKSSSRKVSSDDLKKFPVDTDGTAIDGHIKGNSLENNQQQRHNAKHPREYKKSSSFAKMTSDASSEKSSNIKDGVIQKGRENKILLSTPEKQTSDESVNPISNFKGGVIQKANADKSDTTTENQASDAHIKLGGIKGGVTQKGKSVESTSPVEKQHYTIKMSNASKKTQTSTTEKMGSVDGEATTQKKHVSNIKWSGDKKAVDSAAVNSTSGNSLNFIKIGDIKGEKD